MAAAPDATAATLPELLLIARLALGTPVEPAAAIDWDRVLLTAAAERCAVLAWLRSAPAIRRFAPAATVARWRACAALAASTTDDRLHQLRALLDTLGAAGVAPMVMKGLPLSVMLYGDASARPVSDADVFVAGSQREAAHAALTEAGWVRLYGGRQSEETYRRIEDGDAQFLEIHSSLLDENMLQHLPAPAPEVKVVDVDGVAVVAHRGASLPVFLAVHLAKHPRVPLLWWIDFATAWAMLSDAERSSARAIAKEHRLDRFLAWAIEGAAEIAEIASPGSDANGTLALSRLRARHSRHPVRRITRLASSARDRARVCLAWAFPRAERSQPLTLARRSFARGLGWTLRRLHVDLANAHGR